MALHPASVHVAVTLLLLQRLVVQRAASGSVQVDQQTVASIGRGQSRGGSGRGSDGQRVTTDSERRAMRHVGDMSSAASYSPLRLFCALIARRLFVHVFAGVVVLVGLTAGDGESALDLLARKLLNLRVFDSEPEAADGGSGGGRAWASSVMDIRGDVMLVSQFTLYSVMKGNKVRRNPTALQHCNTDSTAGRRHHELHRRPSADAQRMLECRCACVDSQSSLPVVHGVVVFSFAV